MHEKIGQEILRYFLTVSGNINPQLIPVPLSTSFIQSFFGLSSKKFKLRLFYFSLLTYRIQEWVRLEGTTVGHLVKPPHSNRVIPEHVAELHPDGS